MIFYLGTHVPSWLERTYVPLFISRRRIHMRHKFPRAEGRWALDSGGFSELSLTGKWNVSARQYTQEVRRYSEEIGNMDWAAAQDWMCEPFIIAKTGLSVLEHQRRTVCNYMELMSLAPELPWVPVIQGFEECEYLRCIDMYSHYGVDLSAMPTVGLGSVCRRQGTAMVEKLVRRIQCEYGIRLHGFGFKVLGLERVANALHSADSMAWSMAARRSDRLPKCCHPGNCANCLNYALKWRRELLGRVRTKHGEEEPVRATEAG